MIVYTHPGVVIDWNWSDELTAWTTRGARDDWADAVIVKHRLGFRPGSEHGAAAAAQRWWMTHPTSADASAKGDETG